MFSHLVAFISVDVLPVSRHTVGVRAPSAEPQTNSPIGGFSSFQQRAERVMASRKGFRFRRASMTIGISSSPSRTV